MVGAASPVAESRRYVDSVATRAEVVRLSGREIAAFSTRAPGKQTRNEDSAAWIAWPDAMLMAVADGVGGQPAGGEASELAITMLLERFLGEDQDISHEAFRDGVLDVFENANRQIRGLGVGSGTTFTVATVCNDRARVFSVGDSSTLICGSKGKVRFVNTPHSPTGYAVAAGILDEDDALHHAERHLLSNLVGTPDMHIDIGPLVKLSSGDRILVASDGLWDNMYIDEILKAVRKGPLRKSAEHMRATCRSRMTEDQGDLPGHADDLSFLVMRRIQPRRSV